MKKNIIIIIALLISINIFANSTKEVTTYLSFQDNSHPAESDLTFEVWLTERPSEVITETTTGGSQYSQAEGFLLLRLEKFNTQWESGDHLVVRIFVDDGNRAEVWVGEGTLTLDNTNPQSMANITLNDTDDPLAVTLATFAAVYTGEGPKLQWTTLSETNNSGWNIYRSLNEDFSVSMLINPELINGAGTSTEETTYEFLDETEIIADTTYWYWLESVEATGNTEIFEPIVLQIPADGNSENPEIPVAIGLHGNYPNPFNPSTTISFALEEEGEYTLNIYNVKGQRVLTHNDMITSQNAGKAINFVWEGIDNQGNDVASGLYFYTLHSKSHNYSKKMLLIK